MESRELSGTLRDVMKDVIEIVRLFQELCSSCEVSHQQLSFHSKSRWLSRGSQVLAHASELQGELEIFLREKYFALGQKFEDEKWVLLLSYLGHMTALNTFNESMQEECHTMNDFATKYVLSKKS